MTNRAQTIAAFLDQAGWEGAQHHPLAGDASSRRYTRLSLGSDTAILMDVPRSEHDSLTRFVQITALLQDQALAPPDILASAPEDGLLLLTDLGDQLFARVVSDHPGQERELYHQATQVLIHLANHTPAPELPEFRGETLADNTRLAAQHYANRPDLADELSGIVARALSSLDPQPGVMCLRDFHAENLIWLPQQQGLRRVGLLDYQDAARGYLGFDLISLLQDARRDVSADLLPELSELYASSVAIPLPRFQAQIAILGAQRALRILGIFARLATEGGKPAYLALLPRVWHHLHTNLQHAATAELAAWVHRNLSEPTPAFLAELTAQCR